MKTAFKFKTRPGSRKILSVKGSEVAESKAQNELADVQSQVMTLAIANFNFGPDTTPNFFKKDKVYNLQENHEISVCKSCVTMFKDHFVKDKIYHVVRGFRVQDPPLFIPQRQFSRKIL